MEPMAADWRPRSLVRVPGPLRSWQAARKPNFVLDDHSSRPAITDRLQQPTRKFRNCTLPLGASGRCAPAARKKAAGLPAYLVLLRVGFTMRHRLLEARCALTAPFHPYRPSLAVRPAVSFLLHWPSRCLEASVPDVIRHTALRSSDFPPPANIPADEAGSDRPAACCPSVSQRSWAAKITTDGGS
jgi:hypothetical protein